MTGLTDQCECIENDRIATEDQLTLVHTEAYVERIRRTAEVRWCAISKLLNYFKARTFRLCKIV